MVLCLLHATFARKIKTGTRRWKYSTDIKDLIAAPRQLIEKYALKPFHADHIFAFTETPIWSGYFARRAIKRG